jgi:hypothetical protein
LGTPYSQLNPGEVTNRIRVKIKNRSGRDAVYKIEVVGELSATLTLTENPIPVADGESRTEPVSITVPRSAFKSGKCDITLRISDDGDYAEQLEYRLLGPFGN